MVFRSYVHFGPTGQPISDAVLGVSPPGDLNELDNPPRVHRELVPGSEHDSHSRSSTLYVETAHGSTPTQLGEENGFQQVSPPVDVRHGRSVSIPGSISLSQLQHPELLSISQRLMQDKRRDRSCDPDPPTQNTSQPSLAHHLATPLQRRRSTRMSQAEMD